MTYQQKAFNALNFALQEMGIVYRVHEYTVTIHDPEYVKGNPQGCPVYDIPAPAQRGDLWEVWEIGAASPCFESRELADILMYFNRFTRLKNAY